MRTLTSKKTLEAIEQYAELNEKLKNLKKEVEFHKKTILDAAKGESFLIDQFHVDLKNVVSEVVDRSKVENILGDRMPEVLKERQALRLTVKNNFKAKLAA